LNHSAHIQTWSVSRAASAGDRSAVARAQPGLFFERFRASRVDERQVSSSDNCRPGCERQRSTRIARRNGARIVTATWTLPRRSGRDSAGGGRQCIAGPGPEHPWVSASRETSRATPADVAPGCSYLHRHSEVDEGVPTPSYGAVGRPMAIINTFLSRRMSPARSACAPRRSTTESNPAFPPASGRGWALGPRARGRIVRPAPR